MLSGLKSKKARANVWTSGKGNVPEKKTSEG